MLSYAGKLGGLEALPTPTRRGTLFNGMSATQVYSVYLLYNTGTQLTFFTNTKLQRLTRKAGAGA